MRKEIENMTDAELRAELRRMMLLLPFDDLKGIVSEKTDRGEA